MNRLIKPHHLDDTMTFLAKTLWFGGGVGAIWFGYDAFHNSRYNRSFADMMWNGVIGGTGGFIVGFCYPVTIPAYYGWKLYQQKRLLKNKL